ncbi:hypothetical protein PoMZ_07524 [Pyricularia oryzae]|uniref:Uncharacterized protein n=1 Tax=Pyricularia oryzae TaxID=318829 RepID=A0A4P7NFD9_PYROR|nr:hypothetical protein PoMZ_07524 [Pyricularia oryzae]
MHPVPTDEAMLPMIDGLIDGLISGPFVDGISKQCNNVSLHLLWLLGTQLQSRAWINGTASPDSPLKTAWRRMGRTWVECLSAKKLAVVVSVIASTCCHLPTPSYSGVGTIISSQFPVCSYSAGTASVPGKQTLYLTYIRYINYPYLSSGSRLILDWGCYCYHVTAWNPPMLFRTKAVKLSLPALSLLTQGTNYW